MTLAISPTHSSLLFSFDRAAPFSFIFHVLTSLGCAHPINHPTTHTHSPFSIL